MIEAPFVERRPVRMSDDVYYHAAVALEDVLAWYWEDGYSPDQLRELFEDQLARVMEPAE